MAQSPSRGAGTLRSAGHWTEGDEPPAPAACSGASGEFYSPTVLPDEGGEIDRAIAAGLAT